MESEYRGRKKVIVVDDEFTPRRLIVGYLEDDGYEVHAFSSTDAICDQIENCHIIVMDVRLGKDLPYGGIDYIIEQVQNGVINPSTTKIILMSRWGRHRPGVPERLQKIERFEWLDIGTGLELTELRDIIKKSDKS